MRFVRHPIARLGIIAISFFLCVGLVRSILGNLHLGDIVTQRQLVLQKEEERNRKLHEELRTATSASFIERVARNKLGLAREGETVVLMGKSNTDDEIQLGLGTSQQSLWERWWKLFF